MQLAYKVTIRENGRLVLPAKMRKQLHLKSGDQVTLVLDQDLKIIPLKESIRKFQKLVKSRNKTNISLVEALKHTRSEEAQNE